MRKEMISMKIHSFCWLTLVLLCLVSCSKKYEELYENPNKPTSVPPSLLLNNVMNRLLDAPGGQIDRTNQYQLQNNSYFGNNEYNFGPGTNYYSTLTDVVNMDQAAQASGVGELNPYSALAKFFKAYFFAQMSLQMGDIPMSEALKGAELLTPVYDSQKSVFQQSFDLLEGANADLAQLISNNDVSLDGDMYFSNNLSAWRKVVNTYYLRLLIHLSKQVGDAELNVPGRFSTIISDPVKYPIMESVADNLKYTWLDPTNRYPLNRETFANGALNNSASTYVSLLTSNKDPRVFVTTDPAPGLVSAGGSPTDFSSFQGGDIGADMGVLASQNGGGILSYINRYRYYSGYTGEPTTIIGYTELCFNIAEAIHRGWISGGPLGDAESYYQEGIKSSMTFYEIPEKGTLDVYSLPLGIPISGPYVHGTVNVDYAAFYNQPGVKYAGKNEQGLQQIIEQKYIAFYLNSGLEAYFNWRRTGYPSFKTGVGTGNNGKIALRYKYPAAEQSANRDNYDQAIKQYGGVDDVNGIMWLLK